ncbi:hypothetical protein SCA6_011451 [Theobroma cacao]
MESKWLWMFLVALILLEGWCDGCWEQEKIALLQLKPFFHNIKGLHNWAEGNESISDCCEWERVECNPTTGRVTRLFLNLTTTLTSSDLAYDEYYSDGGYDIYIFEYGGSTERDYWYLDTSLFLPFEELKSLHLSGNSIAGCVHNGGFERLSLKLDKLETLDLSNNNLNDSILSSLSGLSSLKSLYLANNQFTESNSINGINILSKLKNLETLDLRGNILGNDVLSHLNGFTSLKSLRLQECGLQGTVPMLEISHLMNLKELYLGRNQIESFESFREKRQLGFIKLEVLGLSENFFNNSIFSFLGVLSNLKSLYITSNQLKGPIDIKELNALSNLEKLYMGYNEVNDFVSSQDNEIELRLINLQVLDLSWNLFNNGIFSSLGRLLNLKSIYFGGYDLKGFINITELDAFSNLENMYIYCSFDRPTYDGVISTGCSLPLQSLSLFSSLKTLYLVGFSFNGRITTEIWQNLTSLEDLTVEYSSLPSNFIQDIGTLTSLKNLEVYGCEVNGNLSMHGPLHLKNLESLRIYLTPPENNFLQTIGAMPSLKSLSLWNCGLNGTLATQVWQNLTSLEQLMVEFSSFPSNFSQVIGTLTSLKWLVVSGWEVNGNLSMHAWQNLTSLEELTMEYLSLSSIQDIGAMTSLKNLHVFDCEMNGNLSMNARQNWTSLEELTMEYSSLPSNFIQDIGAMTSLKYLFLRYCEVNGNLSMNVWQNLTSLEDLTVGYSSLPSNFIQDIGTLTSLKKLDIDSCEVNGNLSMHVWQNLTSLEDLTVGYSSLPSNFIQDIGTRTSLKNLEVYGCEVNGNLSMHGPLYLKNLESLRIDSTPLESNFLQTIGAVPSLKSLSLSNCGLNGTLRTQGLCELTHLRELYISHNNLNGNLPECFSNLTSLERLDLSFNQFFGNISVLESLTSLESLELSNNYFRIPSSLGPFFNLSKLKYISADNNSIYAETEMHPLAPKFQLHEISLSCCGEGGSFPQFLYHQRDLRYVDLSNIKLIGEFPNWLLENNTKLETVVLANNSLLGHFQLPFLSHLHLSHLDISINSFCGNISIDIGAKLPSLTFLNMSKNYFGGSIPASIGDMNFLQYLDLSNNKLDGGLPEHLAMGCSSLSALILSNNSLQGQIFSANFSLTNLRELQVDENHFSGSIPDCLSNCSDLSILDVSNNQLFDEIPRWMENLSSLSILDLSNNTIFGGIPKWMGNMSSLETIVMANDHLEGPIPMEFCQLNLNLKFLDLSVNNISGSLPSCFNPLRISHVHLSKNKLQGPLANAFRNSSNLVTLDLSNNHLSGNIPNWIGKLSQLSYLLLNNNHFEGRIPLQLCKLSNLSLIDLSHNNLFGIIPPCLKITTLNNISEDHVRYVGAVDTIAPSSSFSAEEPIEFTTKNISYPYKGKILTYLSGIDLSYNKLTGEIPHDVKNFLNIIVLNLAHNNLTGSIPLEFSNLRQIESLDLSYNNLTGKIPPQLAELHFLAYFNVSYNNLSGKTPETGQFATFDENSYLGNLFLCGALLRNNCSAIERTSIDNSEDDGSIDMDVFYVSFIVSYIIVLLGIAVVLYINPYWRRVWFYHIEMGITSSYYFVVDNLPGGFRC